MRRRPLQLLPFLAPLLLARPLAAQPVQLVVDVVGPLPAKAGALAKEHPWIPDVMELVGLRDPGPPIRVLLAGEGTEQAKSAPSWVVGYTDGVSNWVVLLPERTPSYPDGALEEVLAHEVAHVLISRASGGKRLPRWFDEGVAMVAGRSWGIRDRTQFALTLLSGEKVPLWRLDDLFHSGPAEVARAYALSGTLVQDLLEKHGQGLPRALLSRVARGESFDEALERTTGSTPASLGEAFFARQSVLRRWFPVLASIPVLWLAISFLAIVAAMKRRRQMEEARARMEAAERESLAREAAAREVLTPGRDGEDPPGRPDDPGPSGYVM